EARHGAPADGRMDTENTLSIRSSQRRVPFKNPSGHLGAERIFREPGLSVLFEGRGAQKPSRDKHFVRRLQDALEMRRISLYERQWLRQAFQGNPPGMSALGPRDFQQPVDPAGHR